MCVYSYTLYTRSPCIPAHEIHTPTRSNTYITHPHPPANYTHPQEPAYTYSTTPTRALHTPTRSNTYILTHTHTRTTRTNVCTPFHAHTYPHVICTFSNTTCTKRTITNRTTVRAQASITAQIKTIKSKLQFGAHARRCTYAGCPSRHATQFLRCSACHTADYCSAKCQKDDWKRHKKECKMWKDAQSWCVCLYI